MVLAVTSTNSPFISGLYAGLLGIFVGHWILINGTGLSRRACCFIDEASVLRTFKLVDQILNLSNLVFFSSSNWSPFDGNVFSVIEPPTPNGSDDCCDRDIGEEDEGGGVMKILGDAMAQSMPYSDNEKRFDQVELCNLYGIHD